MPEPVIATATAVATSAGGNLGKRIEAAMSAVIGEIEAESNAIWRDAKLTAEQKKERIDAINAPAAVLARRLAARDKVKAEVAKENAAARAAAELKAAEENLAAAKARAASIGVATA